MSPSSSRIVGASVVSLDPKMVGGIVELKVEGGMVLELEDGIWDEDIVVGVMEGLEELVEEVGEKVMIEIVGTMLGVTIGKEEGTTVGGREGTKDVRVSFRVLLKKEGEKEGTSVVFSRQGQSSPSWS